MSADSQAGFTERIIQTGRLRMHVVTAGPEKGEPVILLHGFPEFWYSWRFQMEDLAKDGFLAIAPDQRGYNLTEKDGPYDLSTLTADVAALQDALGISPSHLVGHDWGGAVAWAFASRFPERVKRLIICNAPHPLAYRDTLLRTPAQWIKSLYIAFFQIPYLPEWIFRLHDYRAIERAFATLPASRMSPQDIIQYKVAAAQPGALTAALGWYRQSFRGFISMAATHNARILSPTRVIWGEQDPYLDRRCNKSLPRYVQELDIQYLNHANHWVQMHSPHLVNQLMLDFLRAPKTDPDPSNV